MLDREILSEQFFGLVERIGSRARSGPLDALGDLELTKPQLVTLLLLYKGPQRMSAVAANLHAGPSSTTSLMDRLVAKGLAERVQDPADRRLVICRLTKAGTETMVALYGAGRSKFLDLAALLSLEDLATVVEALQILDRAIDQASKAARNSGATMDGDSVLS